MSMEKMKVVALGGCGGMGRYAVKTALDYSFVDEIVIADLDGVRAQAFAEKCGPKASFQRIDVTDRSALNRLLSEADAVLTTVGPYYRFGVPILRAAIETGCHYIDINDDWEPTLEMLDLNQEAEKAGITAIVGMGASPGQSNLLAAKALNFLDSVDELITGWGVGGDSSIGQKDTDEDGPGGDGSYGAAIEHWVHQLTGKIRVFQDGKYADVKPMQDVHIDYPGLGTGIAYTVGHPEPLTLPLFRTDIKRSCNVMTISPRLIGILRAIAKEVDEGRMTVPEAAQLIMSPNADEEGRQPDADLKKEQSPRLPSLFAYARGLEDGRKKTVGVTVTAGVSGGMGGATGIPMAIGLKLLSSGRIDRHGVFAPEQVIDPDDFFDEFGPLCTLPAAKANAEEMLLVTSS
ncbi:MAG: saccharopine dehydrogenase [Proteobacteria bacterium]|nr:saccharopine dehydrogenase [Pseudomonadota bacterium]